MKLERQGWQSLCDSTGADYYGRLMTDDGIMVLAHGQVFSRQDVIDSLNDAEPWRSYGINEERFIPLGDSAALLVYRGTAYRGDDPTPAFEAVMSSVYVRDGDDWALASHQQTPIPSSSETSSG